MMPMTSSPSKPSVERCSDLSELAVHVYLEDTDATGVVYHANYLKYFERGRTHYMSQLGLPLSPFFEQGLNFVAAKLTINYKLPARFDQTLCVKTEMDSLSKVALVFRQELWRDEQLICSASVTIACIRADSGKPCAWPSEIINAITPHLADRK
ncbi:MAG: YbgC/FadM family acyl-CoA thioesterase [Pseudomonadota bacterium]|nr:YbgC/FadM family acyl-CoA thioesterase [Pseudomonadota bacterium]